MENRRKWVGLALSTILVSNSVLPMMIGSKAHAATLADHVVISEIYGGGGNGGAPYKNDFIELYNPTDPEIVP